MYLKAIGLKNVRGFRSLKFDLTRPDGSHAGWTVFTGDNGSGKSTLLKAIALALMGKDAGRTLQASFSRWISDGHEADGGEILASVAAEPGDTFAGVGRMVARPFDAHLILKKAGAETVLDTLPMKKKTPASRGPWSPESSGWFSCGYGPFRRVFGSSSEAARLMVSRTTERFVTMFHEAASLSEVDQWMRALKHRELEGRAKDREQLAVLIKILQDDLMPNQLRVDRVDSEGLWLRDRNGVQLAWAEMSDGYRAALALLGDILRHLVGTYGFEGLVRESADGRLFVDRGGVVLIDEIDAHLHPEWQREIGFWLKRHFPKIQFLVTTHSPIICQAADPGGLFVLAEPGSGDSPRRLEEDEYRQIVASRPDTILRSAAFGLENTRSPLAVEKRAAYAALSGKKRAGARLSRAEETDLQQLRLFADVDEES